MPIAIELVRVKGQKDIYGPAILCDHCGERIAKGNEGNYFFDMTEPLTAMTTPMYFVHKKCSGEFSKGKPTIGSAELTLLPVYLRAQLDIDWKKAEEDAGFAANL